MVTLRCGVEAGREEPRRPGAQTGSPEGYGPEVRTRAPAVGAELAGPARWPLQSSKVAAMPAAHMGV